MFPYVTPPQSAVFTPIPPPHLQPLLCLLGVVSFALLQSFKVRSLYSSSTRRFMLDKLSRLNKEEAPISAMHFWTPQSSLKDIKYNYSKLDFTMKQ